LLKGPALARLLYRPGEQRRYMDVDVLVEPGSGDAVARVLDRLGFANATAAEGVDDSLGMVPAETWQRERHLLGVDVHARLPGCEQPAEIVWPLLWEGHQTIRLADEDVPVLSRRGLALHLALHAAQHGPRDLKALGDLERGLVRWARTDWEAAAGLADAVGATPAFVAGIRLLPDGEALADGLGLASRGERSWEIANRASRPRGTFHLAALADARGPAAVASVLRRALFPKRAWIERQYPWAARGRFSLAGAYARHLLRTPSWAARAWGYRRRMRRESGR
jgi:hypothetical protein